MKTKDSTLSDAAICRMNAWEPGTRLVGDEGYGPTVIEITAVGMGCILARGISHKGEALDGSEATWTLKNRDWERVS